MKKIYVNVHGVAIANVDDLDIDFEVACGLDPDSDDRLVLLGESVTSDGSLMDIDRLIGYLNVMKNEDGANYVVLENDVDHHGYEIVGYHIKPATNDEIESHEKLVETHKEKSKEQRIKMLRTELNRLEGES